MRLDLIKGPAQTGKTLRLKETLRRAGRAGVMVANPGSDYSDHALKVLVTEALANGATTLGINDIREEQIPLLQGICKGRNRPDVRMIAVVSQ